MNRPRITYLCPGQGAQRVGMGRALAERFPEAGEAFEMAFSILGEDFKQIIWEGPEETLRQTINAQPALLAHSVAALRVLEARGVQPSFAAGHSLGEYSAHVAAGSLSYADTLRLVRRRGELMQMAGEQKRGTMAAVLGMDAVSVAKVCLGVRDAGGGEVVAANLNSGKQIVISGEIPAVESAMKLCKEAGARRVVPLVVSGAFHSSLMEPAAIGLREALANVEIHRARFPVIANATAEPVQEPGDIRETLGEQLLSPVRWEESVHSLFRLGANVFIEIGSGNVLRGLVRSADKSATQVGVEDPESLENTLTALAEVGVEVAV